MGQGAVHRGDDAASGPEELCGDRSAARALGFAQEPAESAFYLATIVAACHWWQAAKDGEFNPMGASFVKESKDAVTATPYGQQALATGRIPPNIAALITKNFDQLSDPEFVTLHQFFSAGAGQEFGGMQTPQVHFARKDERIQNNMLVAMHGVFYRNDGDIPYSTANLDMYAMDQYGDLMVQSTGAFHKGTMQDNHSSLDAGNRAISTFTSAWSCARW